MKIMRKALSLCLVLAAVCTMASCKNQETKSHRLQWWLSAISWDAENRDENVNGHGVTIAVIDSGIDAGHPDLKGKIVEEYSIENKETKNYEHGTAVAGIICATPENENGVLGIAPEAQILSIDISDDETAEVENLIKGILYAVSKDVDIINISAGLLEDNSELREAINAANEKGIIVVAASGNDMYGNILYPAKYENVLSVNSVGENKEKLFGDDGKSVYVPGGNIVTAYSSVNETKKHVSYTGTSMSAPIVTGTIALIIQQNPNLTNSDIYGYFKNYVPSFDVKNILSDFQKNELRN